MTDRRLADVDHTPPYDPRNPVQRRYHRGPQAVADGGAFDPERAGDRQRRRAGADDDTDEDAPESAGEQATLEDVDHTPPDGDGVNHVYRRGTRGE